MSAYREQSIPTALELEDIIKPTGHSAIFNPRHVIVTWTVRRTFWFNKQRRAIRNVKEKPYAGEPVWYDIDTGKKLDSTDRDRAAGVEATHRAMGGVGDVD